MRRLIGTIVAAHLCVGCDSPPEPVGCDEPGVCDATPEPVGELIVGSSGSDGAGFVEIADGSDVEISPGSQGGFHVWLNFRVRGVSGPVRPEREARRVRDGELVFRGYPEVLDVPAEALQSWWDRPFATPAFMCPTPIGVNVVDEEMVFQVRLVTEDGVVLAEDRWIARLRCPEGDLGDFCLEICSG